MRSLRLLLLLLAVLWLGNAVAGGTVPPSQSWSIGGSSSYGSYSQQGSDPSVLCQGFVGWWNSDQRNVPVAPGVITQSGSSWSCKAQDARGGAYGYPAIATISPNGTTCPANSTGSTVCTCVNGTAPDSTGTSCTSACPANRTTSANFTVGWARDNSSQAAAMGSMVSYSGIPPQNSCVPASGGNTCAATLGSVQQAYVSNSPSAGGLYRLSADFAVTYTGGTCPAPSAQADPTEPAPPCDGTTGYFNGKKVCVAPTNAPSKVEPMPSPNVLQGNPAAGTSTSATGTGGIDGTRTGGSSGGNDGGPPTGSDGQPLPVDSSSSGAAPSLPPGAVGSGQQQQQFPPCGIPGQPACKMDETGTPTQGDFGNATGVLNQSKTDALTGISNAASPNGKVTSWGWTFVLPSSCSVIPLYGGVVFDVCKYQPEIWDLMSMLWAGATVFLLIGMVGRTVRGS